MLRELSVCGIVAKLVRRGLKRAPRPDSLPGRTASRSGAA